MQAPRSSSMDLDDEDEDDDVATTDDQGNNQLAMQAANMAQLYYNEPQGQPQVYQSPVSSDLKTAASHHHHGHGVKGWLDMGAWTGKKGAFGWHDKHPVGKKGK